MHDLQNTPSHEQRGHSMNLPVRQPIFVVATAVAVALAVVAPALGVGARLSTPERTATTSAARCATSGLVVWINTQGDGTAGSIYYKLEFTNLSGRACSLSGYPGVSAVDLGGRQLGSAGSRNTSRVRTVSLATGATATAVLRITEAGNFPNSTCHRVSAAGVRVYPSNQTASKVVPFPFDACSRTGPVYLSVEAVA
jgi:hypothetical protein